MILSREQVEERKQYDCEYVSQIWIDDYIDTIEHLQQELKKMRERMLSNMNVSIKAISTQAEKIKQLEEANTPKPISEWYEDDGDCLWWKFPIEEPPYCGNPLDCDFPNYVTHFTKFLYPKEVEL